jgi:hypothetical protein
MSKLFLVNNNEVKCGACNWETGSLYILANTQEEAESLYLDGKAGMCGECMCNFLVEEVGEVTMK